MGLDRFRKLPYAFATVIDARALSRQQVTHATSGQSRSAWLLLSQSPVL